MLENSIEILPQNKRLTIPSAFLLKTFEILENADYSNVIAWNKDGDAFSVKDMHEFSEKVLPRYFKHNNYQSFVRQLNMYDFHKYRKNEESFFKHSYFKRGQKHLLNKIKRKTNVNFVASYALQEYVGPKISPEMRDIVFNLKSKQGELEQTLSYLISQNYHLLNENKRLWSELLMHKINKDDSKEKLIYFLLQNKTQLGNRGMALGNSIQYGLRSQNTQNLNKGWNFSGEQDSLLQKLLSSFCNMSNMSPEQTAEFNPYFNMNSGSKKIKKKKTKNLERLREKMEQKLKASEDQQINDFNHFSPFQIEDLWDQKNANEEIKINNEEEPVIYNFASPSAFLNIESNSEMNEGRAEEELKKTNDSSSLERILDGKKGEGIFGLERGSEALI